MRIAPVMAVVFGLASLSMPALAHTEGACKEDVKKFCGDIKPGDGKIRDCMKAHESEFSQTCKDNIAEGKEKMKKMHAEIKEACKADIQKFCANVTPGEGREMACLRSYEDKVSPTCKEKMPKRMEHKGMMMMKKDAPPATPATK